MEAFTIHPAEAYLRNEQNPTLRGNAGVCLSTVTKMSSALSHRGNGKEAIFLRTGQVSRRYITRPKSRRQAVDTDRKMILKYQKLAQLATHANDWLRKIANADLEKSLYENRITTGTRIDGQCIRLSTIEKYCGSVDMHLFREAVKQGKQFSTVRFDFRGYDGTLWCEPRENGDVMAGFSKEYRGCLNGYYYLLINDEYMIGYDID